MRTILNWPVALLLPLVFSAGLAAQAPSAKNPPASPQMADTEKKNVQEYVELLRSDVRQQKAEIMGAVMALNIEDSAKFWPIYNEYDGELTKLNNQRLANVKEYAANYDSMTDAKADELVRNALQYRKQRGELVAKYYGQIKDALGGVQAARFLQVEEQLLMIIDLQIASSLPVIGQGS